MEQKMDKKLENLLKKPVFQKFQLICGIPHPSTHEKQLSDFICRWALDLGLEAWQDAMWNVGIKKPASPGYEAAPTVMLQAHIDMVCEQAPNVGQDFLKDPILLHLDGDILSTGGRTTLGADNGIGVAYAMQILEDSTLAHPPLEVLFTTREEYDFRGAMDIETQGLKGQLLINLDNAVESELIAGSCGGMGVSITIPAECGDVPDGYRAYKLALSGLPGGHSGEDIHRGYGNAISLLGRLLYAQQQKYQLRIGSVTGGNFRLAIPREACAVVLLPADAAPALLAATEQMREQLLLEYGAVAPKLQITAQECEFTGKAASFAATERMLCALRLSPNGIIEMHNMVHGVVESSNNLGELYLEDNQFRLEYEIRASLDSTRESIYERLCILAKQLGAQCRGFAMYPCWAYQPDQALQKLAKRVFQQQFGREQKTILVHAGLECGFFLAKLPGLQAIAIGPNMWGLHSPEERVSVSSTERVYNYLTALLAAIQ